MLYVFAGFPKTGLPSRSLNAGGLRVATEAEGIGLLEESPNVQYRKEGVFFVTPDGEERRGDAAYRMSDLCLRDGIGWDWFPENWSFGNGVTAHKTTAQHAKQRVAHLLTSTSDPERRQEIVESWFQYERRWLPGTCPQADHIVHLTWLVFSHTLPEHAYEKLRRIVEAGQYELSKSGLYEPKRFSPVRTWNGSKEAMNVAA